MLTAATLLAFLILSAWLLWRSTGYAPGDRGRGKWLLLISMATAAAAAVVVIVNV